MLLNKELPDSCMECEFHKSCNTYLTAKDCPMQGVAVCEDAISRQAVLDYLDKMPSELTSDGRRMVRRRTLEKYISDTLPSVQPKQKWISVKDRMPEEREWIGTKKFGTTKSDEVYVTFEAPDGQRFTTHLSFQNGKLSISDQQKIDVWFKGSVTIAWAPLPKPWEGEKSE